MTQPDEQECAVWYWQHYAPCYELFDNEREAAGFAANLENSGDGSVAGIQFSDGRTIERDRWGAYRAEQVRLTAQWERDRRERANTPPPPTRKIRHPFDGSPMTIEAGEPAWLGRRQVSDSPSPSEEQQ
jgi:hypothetical protein